MDNRHKKFDSLKNSKYGFTPIIENTQATKCLNEDV